MQQLFMSGFAGGQGGVSESLETVLMHQYVQRWQQGDKRAADQLLRTVGERLEQLARRMLRSYPNVRAWADTADVHQGAVIRLLHTLRKLQPESTRSFFNLAAVHIRRELLDLARRFKNLSHLVHPLPEGRSAGETLAVHDPAAADELEVWARFHLAVEELPTEEREVFSLVFYHGWTQDQIAALFGVHVRTVRRRWQHACIELHRQLDGQLPAI